MENKKASPVRAKNCPHCGVSNPLKTENAIPQFDGHDGYYYIFTCEKCAGKFDVLLTELDKYEVQPEL